MPAPYSYLDNIQPVDLASQMQGMYAAMGRGLTDVVLQRAEEQRAQALAQQQAEQQAALMAEKRQAYQEWIANPTLGGWGDLLIRFPDLKDQVEKARAGIKEEEKQALLPFIGQTLSFLQGGQTDLAIENIKRRNEALKNSSVPNRDALIAHNNALLQAIEQGPEGINSAAASLIRDYSLASETADPAKFAELQAQLPFAADYAKGRAEKISAEADKAKIQADSEVDRIRLQLKRTQQEIDESRARIKDMAARQALDERKLDEEMLRRQMEHQEEGQVHQNWVKRLDDLSVDESALSMDGDKALALASEIENTKPSGGLKGRLGDAISAVFGSVNISRKKYIRFMNSDLGRDLSALKGATSDRDLARFVAGYPSDYTEHEEMASYLRGQAKANYYSSRIKQAQAEWIVKNGANGPANAMRGMTVLGYPVRPGMSFADFRKANAEDILLDVSAAASRQRASGGTMRRFVEPEQSGQQQAITPSEPEQAPMYIFR